MRGHANKYIATFLILVFSINIIVGFACAAGLDMGFNTKHHHHDGKEAAITDEFDHHNNTEEQNHQHHHLANSHKESDDNCCNKGVAEFSQSDKLLAHFFSLEIQSPAFLGKPVFYNLSESPLTSKIHTLIRVFRSRFFTLPDIRVSIRSFQI